MLTALVTLAMSMTTVKGTDTVTEAYKQLFDENRISIENFGKFEFCP